MTTIELGKFLHANFEDVFRGICLFKPPRFTFERWDEICGVFWTWLQHLRNLLRNSAVSMHSTKLWDLGQVVEDLIEIGCGEGPVQDAFLEGVICKQIMTTSMLSVYKSLVSKGIPYSERISPLTPKDLMVGDDVVPEVLNVLGILSIVHELTWGEADLEERLHLVKLINDSDKTPTNYHRLAFGQIVCKGPFLLYHVYTREESQFVSQERIHPPKLEKSSVVVSKDVYPPISIMWSVIGNIDYRTLPGWVSADRELGFLLRSLKVAPLPNVALVLQALGVYFLDRCAAIDIEIDDEPCENTCIAFIERFSSFYPKARGWSPPPAIPFPDSRSPPGHIRPHERLGVLKNFLQGMVYHPAPETCRCFLELSAAFGVYGLECRHVGVGIGYIQKILLTPVKDETMSISNVLLSYTDLMTNEATYELQEDLMCLDPTEFAREPWTPAFRLEVGLLADTHRDVLVPLYVPPTDMAKGFVTSERGLLTDYASALKQHRQTFIDFLSTIPLSDNYADGDVRRLTQRVICIYDTLVATLARDTIGFTMSELECQGFPGRVENLVAYYIWLLSMPREGVATDQPLGTLDISNYIDACIADGFDIKLCEPLSVKNLVILDPQAIEFRVFNNTEILWESIDFFAGLSNLMYNYEEEALETLERSTKEWKIACGVLCMIFSHFGHRPIPECIQLRGRGYLHVCLASFITPSNLERIESDRHPFNVFFPGHLRLDGLYAKIRDGDITAVMEEVWAAIGYRKDIPGARFAKTYTLASPIQSRLAI